MKLLYAGGSACSQPTFKRLLLLGSEISFMDRPSVMFGPSGKGQFGTIGHQSVFRRVDATGSAVPIAVYEPPKLKSEDIYHPYAEADFANPEFARTILEGIRNDEIFTTKFLQLNANYSDGVTGRMIGLALAHATDIEPLTFADDLDPKRMYTIDTTRGLQNTLKVIMHEASVQVTSALVVAADAQAVPVSDDPYFLKLLSLRTSSASYVGAAAASPASVLGFEFSRAVIPDDALQEMSVADILNYRKKTASLYKAWTSEIEQIAAKIDNLPADEVQERILKLILTELKPRLTAHQNEMAAVRDDLFAGLAKGAVNWKVPALSIASYTAMGYAAAMVAFAGSLASAAAPPLIDYAKQRRNVSRKHAVSYLVGARDAK